MALPQVGLEAVIDNLAGFSKGADTITKAYDKIDTGADKVAKSSGGLSGVFSSVGGGLLSLGKVAAGVALGGVTLLGGGLVALGTKSVLAAADVGEMQSLFNTAFGQDAPKARQEIDEFAAAVGRNKFELEGFAGGIKSLLTPMGVTREASNEMSVGFSKLAVDLSSFFNVTESDALDALRSGLIGETEPLRKFGIVLNQAAIEQKALNMGIFDGEGQMDAATKAAATYALIMEQTQLAQGDAARTSGSWVNQTRALKSAIDETVVEIGMQLIPVLTPLLQQFTQMVKTYLPQLVEWFKTNLPIAIQAAKDAWIEIQPVLSTVWKIITEDVIPAIKSIVTWFKKDVPAGSAKLQTALKPVIDKVLPKMVEIFEIIRKWVIKNWPLIQKTITTVMDNIEQKIKTVTKIVAYIWENWGEEIKTTVELVFKIVKVNLENMLDTVTLIMQIITGDWSGAWETIKDIASRNLGLIAELVKASFNNMLKIVTDIMNSIKNKISEIWSSIVGEVKNKVNEVYNAIKSKFDSLASLIAGYASTLLNAARTMMQGIVNGINSMLSTITSTLSTVMTNAVNSLRNAITSGSIYSTLVSVGQSIMNAIKNGISAVTDLASRLIATVQGAINQLSSAMSSGTIYNILVNTGHKIINTIRDAVTSVTDFASAIRSKLGEWLGDLVSGSLFTTLRNTGRKIVEEIKNGFIGAQNVFNLARDAIKNWILSWFSPIPEARYAGGEIVDNILLGFYAQRGKFIAATRLGLTDWVAQVGMGLNAVIAPPVNAPALGATGSTSIYNTFQVGGNTINSGMDQAQFETRVLRVIRKNL